MDSWKSSSYKKEILLESISEGQFHDSWISFWSKGLFFHPFRFDSLWKGALVKYIQTRQPNPPVANGLLKNLSAMRSKYTHHKKCQRLSRKLLSRFVRPRGQTISIFSMSFLVFCSCPTVTLKLKKSNNLTGRLEWHLLITLKLLRGQNPMNFNDPHVVLCIRRLKRNIFFLHFLPHYFVVKPCKIISLLLRDTRP